MPLLSFCLKEQEDENRRLLSLTYLDYGYAFCKPNGDFYRPDFISNKFSAVLEKAGLPHMRIHNLRHSAASVLYDLGWDIERIKSWLRHSDIKTMSNIYTHISKERRKIDAYELRELYHQDKNDGEKNGGNDNPARQAATHKRLCYQLFAVCTERFRSLKTPGCEAEKNV